MRVFGGVSGEDGMLLAVCVAIGLLAAGGVAGANELPVADAGLDQSAERNATVYLDAGGSYDSDGEVAAHEWSVVAPNGTAFEPACATCERTRFRATQTGQYNVTVTVTDATGAQASDTVYVTVNEPDPPALQISGPESLFVGTDGTVRADVRAGDDPLSRLVWSVDGSDAGSETLTGPDTRERTLSFTEAGTHTVTAAVTDVLGRTTTDTHTIEVIENTAPSGSGAPGASGGGGVGSGSFDASADFVAANADAIQSYSDLSFNNYADGDSAITIGNSAGPGTITLVDGETAQRYLEPYNWHNVNLGDLVEDDLVDTETARKVLSRAQRNQDELGNGAVGGINPYESVDSQKQPDPPSTVDAPTPPPAMDTLTSPAALAGTDVTGPQSSETVTLTPGSRLPDPDITNVDEEHNKNTQRNSTRNTDSGSTNNNSTETNPRRGSDTVTFV